jgi:TRAP-type C4-dicarboxylate transport system substrate-binding protein
MCPFEALKGWKLGEVCNFTTMNYGSSYSTGFFVVMNKAKWNSLPVDAKQAIQKINEEWIEKQGKIWDEIDGGKAMTSRAEKIALSKEEDARWAGCRPRSEECVATKSGSAGR